MGHFEDPLIWLVIYLESDFFPNMQDLWDFMHKYS